MNTYKKDAISGAFEKLNEAKERNFTVPPKVSDVKKKRANKE
ncbi:hypothetical protein [Niallia nealsonii]|nr:hypothetical protein [Niallia nealsonii]